MFTADVALEGQDEIAQDSSSTLAHSQGTFCRVVDFRINTSAPAVGLSFVPPKTTKTAVHIIWYHMQVSCCTNPKKKQKIYHDPYSYLLVQQLNYYLDVRKEKSNPTHWNHFEILATMSRFLEDTKNCCRLATL